MARFWVVVMLLAVTALTGLASLTADRTAGSAIRADALENRIHPAAMAPASTGSGSLDAAAHRRSYERRHQRAALFEVSEPPSSPLLTGALGGHGPMAPATGEEADTARRAARQDLSIPAIPIPVPVGPAAHVKHTMLAQTASLQDSRRVRNRRDARSNGEASADPQPRPTSDDRMSQGRAARTFVRADHSGTVRRPADQRNAGRRIARTDSLWLRVSRDGS